MVWFAVNAQLDGVDPGSDLPSDRLKFVVYQRRLLLEAMKTKATLQALCGQAEAAAKTASMYIEMAIPVNKLAEGEKDRRMEEKLQEIAEMAPVKVVPPR